ncbi:MarR family winged helix-turn-helix transcriptional regulator [Actinacidiphila acididurans]|uniref:MarR family transcriptional regulator n=1 Tax=Actinacidiphila acididurans TaxID=2784346 RepID=A0ABS2TSC6_9ACTN|nr:MarR family transcriptional regulator [Actinacidiphila acididurans]MBM9506224.1 MarR family transcriptional regulator [Actinacidiphila acididurans]
MTHTTGARSGRWLTPYELATWRAFIETAEQLRNVLGARLREDSGLSEGDYAVLLALSEAEGRRLRSSALAAHIDWERSRLSHHLGRMERRGLIAREECEDDNRGAEVVATAEGMSAFRRATVPHLRAVRELFLDALTPEQLDAVAEITAVLRDRLPPRP